MKASTRAHTGGTARALKAVGSALGGRRLVWFGIRGEDGEPLEALPEFASSFSIIAPSQGAGRTSRVTVCLETLRGSRPDHDRYDIDCDTGSAADEFRSRMLRELAEACVVATYRPSALVSAFAFSMAHSMTLAGLFSERQLAFEHKPWVESALRARGVRGLDWAYVAYEHRSRVRRMLADGPRVLRASHTSGGVGIALARVPEDVDRLWPSQGDAFAAVAPLLAGVPINFSGCVFGDGQIRMHPPSVQLVGVASCTNRPFGYCGNDFGALPSLCDRDVLGRIDELGRAVGRWLYEERYLGAFGVDAIVADGDVVFTEVNARFQGSSFLSSQIARELDVPDLFLDHLGATLGLAPFDDGLSIVEWARNQPPLARVVVHNTSEGRMVRVGDAPRSSLPAGAGISQLACEVPVEPGATLGAITLARALGADGSQLDARAGTLVEGLRGAFAPLSRAAR